MQVFATRKRNRAARVAVQIAVFAIAVSLAAIAFSGGAVAHDDGDGLTVHNQTEILDQHGEVHTLTIDSASADTDYYVDLHTENGTVNTTRTFAGGTTQENFDVTLSPTITSDTEVAVATHAANGTELASETISVSVVEAPTVSFSDQVHQLDQHDEVHSITVDTAAANEDYYVDVHTVNGTINTTQTFDGGTAQTDLELTLDPTLTETTNVTAAVHATNGTELAAQTATVATTDVQFSNQTHELDEHGEIHHITANEVSAGVPYYIDVHTNDGTINRTETFEAGTSMEAVELELSPTIASDTDVTVALHSEGGTEIAASTAMVSVTGAEQMQTETMTPEPTPEPTEEPMKETDTPEPEGQPGFGAVIALVALLGAALLAARWNAN